MIKKKIIIIGAGPCGIGAAWKLNEMGFKNFIVLEKENYVGGLATSILDNNGFTWDLGGHVLHSHYQYFDNFFESVANQKYNCLTRSAWIYIFNRYIPYPFQHNIHFLPKKIFEYCLHTLPLREKNINLNLTYKEWMYSRFGKGIANTFSVPYAKKVWSFNPQNMGTYWIKDRVAKINKTVFDNYNSTKSINSSWGPNYRFKYPHFGNGYIWHQAGNKLKKYISLNEEIIKINYIDQTVKTNHHSYKYEQLLTTLPIDFLQSICYPKLNLGNFPLKYSTIVLVGIGMKGKLPNHLSNKLWIYYHSDKIPFFRAMIQSNFSPSLAPQESCSILTESSFDTESIDIDKLISKILICFKKLKYTDGNNITSIWFKKIKRGYPIPTNDRDIYLIKINNYLEQYNIYTRGRFGMWKYEVSNQDHTFMQGVEWADRIMNNTHEITINNPNFVNK